MTAIGMSVTATDSDAEIAEMTRWFEAHTLERHGRYRVVEPTVVVEVAFDVIMRSARHRSGFALRFPRIARLRPDKDAAEADTLATEGRVQHLQQMAPVARDEGRLEEGQRLVEIRQAARAFGNEVERTVDHLRDHLARGAELAQPVGHVLVRLGKRDLGGPVGSRDLAEPRIAVLGNPLVDLGRPCVVGRGIAALPPIYRQFAPYLRTVERMRSQNRQ